MQPHRLHADLLGISTFVLFAISLTLRHSVNAATTTTAAVNLKLVAITHGVDDTTTPLIPVTHRRPKGDSYNYQNFPVPHVAVNSTSICNVPQNYKGVPHICDVDRYLNDTTYYELEAEILKLHEFVPKNNKKNCPGWQVAIGLMKQFKDEAGSIHSEFDLFGRMLLKRKWRFLGKCITDVVLLVAVNDPLATLAMTSYSHGEIPIHCRENVLTPGTDATKGAPLFDKERLVEALKEVLQRLSDIQQNKENASVCQRSWFIIHIASIIAGLTMGVLFIVILWSAYCITGRCGTCGGETPGFNRRLK